MSTTAVRLLDGADTTVISESEIPDTRSFFQKIVDESIELIGTQRWVCFKSKNVKELRYVQRSLHTYGNARGFKIKTRSAGRNLYVSVDRPLTDYEVVKRYTYRCNEDRR